MSVAGLFAFNDSTISSTTRSRSPRGHHPGDCAETLCLVSVDQPTGKHQFDGGLPWHHAGEERRDHHRPQPEPDLGGAQLGVVDADGDVAGDGQPESPGQRMPVDPGHRRFPASEHEPEEFGKRSPGPCADPQDRRRKSRIGPRPQRMPGHPRRCRPGRGRADSLSPDASPRRALPWSLQTADCDGQDQPA